MKLRTLGVLGVAGAALWAAHGATASPPAYPGPAAAKAVAYAEAQIGHPYQWGGTGPDAFDCSGLTMMAYRAAGIVIPRTSQEQWAAEPHVSAPRPGDLVFFTGSLQPGESPPGHVGIVIGHGQMVEANSPAVGIRVASYNRADLVGFARP